MGAEGQIPLHQDGGVPLMGPVFYLVQSNGVRDPISAVPLGNWPHELQPWPCASGAGDGTTHRGSGLSLSARVGGWGRRFWGRF